MDEQRLLAGLLQRHYEKVSRGLGNDAEPAVTGYRVAAVVGTFEPHAFITGALAFAVAIPEPVRDPWYRSFTRAVFFAGNPHSVSRRFRCDHVGGGVAWLGPALDDPKSGLSRGLKLLRAPAPCTGLPATVTTTVPGPAAGPGRRHLLRVATGEVSVAEYLVHVHHVLCEAVLCATLRPGDELTVSHADHLTADHLLADDGPGARAATHLRIADDPHRAGARRLYACLTSDVPTQPREADDD